MYRFVLIKTAIGFVLLLALAGCPRPLPPASYFQPVPLEQRQAQSRTFEAAEELKVLQACTELLMDNGYQVKEAESRIGWIHAFKATQSSDGPYVHYKTQVDIVTRPLDEPSGRISVRVIFYAGSHGYTWSHQEPAVYQEFFDRLSKALFMEAQI